LLFFFAATGSSRVGKAKSSLKIFVTQNRRRGSVINEIHFFWSEPSRKISVVLPAVYRRVGSSVQFLPNPPGRMLIRSH
jgi:hypothetical protein